MKGFLNRIFARKNDKEVEKINNSPLEQSSENTDIYSADNAIKNPDLDEFNRRDFSERIAKTIATRKESKSLVIGIYGKWGEGKTTVLNFIAGELKHHDNIVPLTFNPWLFPSEAELLVAFYSELAKAIGKSLSTRKEDAGKFIKDYVGALAGFFDKKEAVEKIGGFLSDVRLEELRDRIGSFLIGQKKSVVVLMDDIDRLDKNEIHAVFRLVKLSANLENVVYVLAFDRDVVEEALSERYVSKKENPGQNFLEKIVQVPINLPKVPKSDLRSFCYKQINKALHLNGIEISESDAQEFTRGFAGGIEIRLETPRMAIRYANMLNFSLPLVNGEVHIAEFLLIEAIRAFYPDAYEVIKDNRDAFTAVSLGGMNTLPSEKDEKKRTVEKVFNDLTDDEKSNLKRLLITLFPRLKTIFENTIYGSEWDKTWAEQKRIASNKYFDRYFTYSIPVGDVSDILIEKFIQSLEEIDSKELIVSLQKELSAQNAESFIAKLHQKLEKIHPAGKIKLAICLSIFGNTFPNPKDLFSFTLPFSRAALLISRLIESLPEDVDKADLAVQVVNVAEPITFAYEIIKWLRSKKPGDESKAISSEDIQKISSNLANRIESLAIQDAAFFDTYPDQAHYLIWFWGKFGSKDNADKFLSGFLNTDIQNVHKLLSSVVPVAYGEGLPQKSDFERDQYNNLETFVDIDMVYDILKKEYEGELESEQYPYDYDKPLELRLARQFAWIHKKVVEEQNNKQQTLPTENGNKDIDNNDTSEE